MADSAFPVGGFAYSHGLESAMKHGFFPDHNSLREYLITFSEQVISFDFAFVSSAFPVNKNTPDYKFILELTKSYEAMLLNPQIRKASLLLGRNWIRICRQISQNVLLDELEVNLVKQKIPPEFPVIYGLTSGILGIDLDKTLNLFFYMTIRDQISAVIRLGIAGPAKAQQELRYLIELFGNKIENYVPRSYRQAYKSAYLLELAQLNHEKVYSKLFQN